MRRLAFHQVARSDLFGLYRYIEERSGAERAGGYVARIERLCLGLTELPDRGSPRADIVPGLRTLNMERRVLIAYQVSDQEVTILRVLYAGRDFTAEDVPH